MIKVRVSATQSIYEILFPLRFMDSSILKTKLRFKSSAIKQKLKKEVGREFIDEMTRYEFFHGEI